MRSFLLTAAIAATTTTAILVPDPDNDYSCTSTHNPVVTLHGLGATYYEDINFLGDWLKTEGFCVFRATYGSYPDFPLVGGFLPINESAVEVADFITDVSTKTGADKVDIVGHSEGAFLSLYVPKFQAGISDIVQRIVSIAPPTHGTNFANLVTLGKDLGVLGLVEQVLDIFGCHACDDLVDDGWAIKELDDGKPIIQPGNSATIIISKWDELVTPTTTSLVNETSAKNEYIQDYCSYDPVGHIGEAYDLNVWNLVKNALEDVTAHNFQCVVGSPGKKV
ncbi:Alpha/Beta hydrolase protein [Talaromyces proteolyticus]|uniref:Alpha/Beta hydrolase protein n=1 Tax=Talaromyces proteolyticus TaxID=1131652 RepID=A0AAD4L3L8_9EURO|nr:Alpha/Beta hydrolase protein [Talaromyces proteolyticus]KAH8704004.1 Alpha/Beta hydrolase protein [Talaromyces proteolyticus]